MSFWKNLKYAFRDRRAEAIRELAPSLSMQYKRKDDLGVLHLLKDFRLFQKGSNKRIKNLLLYDDPMYDLKIRIFDYQYTISTGNSSQTFTQTVFFINTKALGLPDFYLKPENFFHKIGQWLGKKDINFTSHPVFSDAYYLKGEDEALVRHTFSENVLHYFTVEKDWSVEGLNYFLIVYKDKKKMLPEDIKHFYQKGMEIYQILKEEGFSI